MTTQLEEVRSLVMALPSEERVILGNELIESAVPEQRADECTNINQVLMERSEGPFFPFDPNDDSFWQRIEDNAVSQIKEKKHA